MRTTTEERYDMERTRIIRPGLLVAVRTSVTGGVHYDRRDIEATADGTEARWETTRHIDDPAEHKAAGQMVGLAIRPIVRMCVTTGFGLVCPSEREEELDTAMAAARLAVDAWNAQAKWTWITVNMLKGRIADNDEEAVRSLLGEATGLVNRMKDALSAGDVKAIRDAAWRAKSLTRMMDDAAGRDMTDAVTAARKAAREIVRRVAAEGVEAETVVATVDQEAFDRARFSFLDAVEAEEAALPVVDVQRMAEIEAFRQEQIEGRRPVEAA